MLYFSNVSSYVHKGLNEQLSFPVKQADKDNIIGQGMITETVLGLAHVCINNSSKDNWGDYCPFLWQSSRCKCLLTTAVVSGIEQNFPLIFFAKFVPADYSI